MSPRPPHLAIALATLIASLLGAAPAFADLTKVDLATPGDGLVVRDDVSGLDWLSPTVTQLLSVDQILAGECGLNAQCPAGGWPSEGWRHARLDEVCDIWDQQGATHPCPGYGPGSTTPSLVNLFGDTDGWGSTKGFFDDTVPFADGFANGRAGRAVNQAAIPSYWGASSSVGQDTTPTDFTDYYGGHFLVRFTGWTPGDHDVDGIANADDNCPEWPNPGQADADGDGNGDACDSCPFVFDASQSDLDLDGVGDACNDAEDADGDDWADVWDNCPATPNPSQADTDDDGVGDACNDAFDADGDEIADGLDNCPATPNVDQTDTDGDGIGDACIAADDDGDGITAELDNCPWIANPGQQDTDGDGRGDACNLAFDADGDEWDDAIDNCPTVSNPSQADADGDHVGDACNDAIDRDGDEWADGLDVCPDVFGPTQQDTDGDGVGDACNDAIDADGDEWSDALDVCPGVADPAQTDTDGDGVGDACNSAIDPDGDELAGPADNCPGVPNPNQSDTDDDGIGDVCDTPTPGIDVLLSTDVDMVSGSPFAIGASGEIYVATDAQARRYEGGTYTLLSPPLVFGNVRGVAVDDAGNVYVVDEGRTRVEVFDASGSYSHRLIDRVRTQSKLYDLIGMLVGDAGIYVADGLNANVFDVDPDGIHWNILIDRYGDGAGHTLDDPYALAEGPDGSLYVAGATSDNAFRVHPDGSIEQIIDATGDGTHALNRPLAIAVDPNGVVYVGGYWSENVFRIDTDGTVTHFMDVRYPTDIAAGADGQVFVTGGTGLTWSDGSTTTLLIGLDGDHAGHRFWSTAGLGLSDDGHSLFVAARTSRHVFEIDLDVLAPCATPGDPDGDGLVDACDVCPDTFDPDQTDTDGDGVGDACNDADDLDGDEFSDLLDVCPTFANPGQENTDGASFGDACNSLFDPDGDDWESPRDVCPDVYDPLQTDTDGDGVGDACNEADDADGDEWADALDVCPGTADPDQTDTDGDGVGDACNDGIDADGDEWAEALDVCPGVHDPSQADADGDGVGDACNDAADADGDEWAEALDNCPGLANPTQADADGDGVGDACNDAFDSDGDEWADALDDCPGAYDPLQLDLDGDGVGDACDFVARIVDSAIAHTGERIHNIQPEIGGSLVYYGTDRTIHRRSVEGEDLQLLDELGQPLEGSPRAPAPQGGFYYTDGSEIRHVDAAGSITLVVDTVGDPGFEPPDEMELPIQLVVEPSGHLLIGNARSTDTRAIVRLDPGTGAVEPLAQMTANPGGVSVRAVLHLARGADGAIFAGRSTGDNVVRIGPEGDFSELFATDDSIYAGRFVVTSDGTVHASSVYPAPAGLRRASASGDEGWSLTPEGDWLGVPVYSVRTVAVDALDRVYAGSGLNKEGTTQVASVVHRVAPDGVVDVLIDMMLVDDDMSNPDELAVGPDGSLYLLTYRSDVYRILPGVCEGHVDSDGDGLEDQCDVCPYVADPTQLDGDGDGHGDACDAPLDTDDDGIGRFTDNCLGASNPDQQDSDDDGLGDACDNCPGVANASQLDRDLDGVGDACNDALDGDGDEFADAFDNCPGVSNPDQRDADSDGLGDACNAHVDADGDEWADGLDNCPGVPNPDQLDLDGDGVGDACAVLALPVGGGVATPMLLAAIALAGWAHLAARERGRRSA